MSPMAPADLEDLDHSFYLFQDAESDADAVVYHRDDDRIGVIGSRRAPIGLTRRPTIGGGPVSQSADEMLAYHLGALDGSPANAAPISRGWLMTLSVETLTLTDSKSMCCET